MYSYFTILIGLLNTQVNTLFVFLFRAEMLINAAFALIDEVLWLLLSGFIYSEHHVF